jgi:hypothetical protein
MKATQRLHDLGQSIWLDNSTRDMLTSGTLKHYIDELSVTGLTANPTILDHAITKRFLRCRDPREAQGRQVLRPIVGEFLKRYPSGKSAICFSTKPAAQGDPE